MHARLDLIKAKAEKLKDTVPEAEKQKVLDHVTKIETMKKEVDTEVKNLTDAADKPTSTPAAPANGADANATPDAPAEGTAPPADPPAANPPAGDPPAADPPATDPPANGR